VIGKLSGIYGKSFTTTGNFSHIRPQIDVCFYCYGFGFEITPLAPEEYSINEPQRRREHRGKRKEEIGNRRSATGVSLSRRNYSYSCLIT
jgi:hypothetical protein